jgi:hypothetical protein
MSRQTIGYPNRGAGKTRTPYPRVARQDKRGGIVAALKAILKGKRK